MIEIRSLLEPDRRDQAPKTWVCESVSSYTTSPDPWNELVKHAPLNCRRNPRLHQQWFIYADKKDLKEQGVLLVHTGWDGNIYRDPDELLKIASRANLTTKTSPVNKVRTNPRVLVSTAT